MKLKLESESVPFFEDAGYGFNMHLRLLKAEFVQFQRYFQGNGYLFNPDR